MRYGDIESVVVKVPNRYDFGVLFQVEIEMTVDYNVAPRLIEALNDEPVARLLGENLTSAEYVDRDGMLQCCNCGGTFKCYSAAANYCPNCGAQLTGEAS